MRDARGRRARRRSARSRASRCSRRSARGSRRSGRDRTTMPAMMPSSSAAIARPRRSPPGAAAALGGWRLTPTAAARPRCRSAAAARRLAARRRAATARLPLRLLLPRELPLRIRVLVSGEPLIWRAKLPDALAFGGRWPGTSTGAWRSSPAARPASAPNSRASSPAAACASALIDIDADPLEAVAASIPGAETAVADVRDARGLTAAIDDLARRLGGIDVAVANAGIATGGPLRMVAPETVEDTIDVNLLGVWRTARAALPHVLERRGHLLLIASAAAVLPAAGLGAYSASKAGRRGARALAAGGAAAARRDGRHRLLPVPGDADGRGGRATRRSSGRRSASSPRRSRAPGRWSPRSRAP